MYDQRELDLENAVVTETLHGRVDEQTVEKEYLSSFPDGVIAVRIRSKGRPVSLSVLLTRERFYDRSGKLDDHSIFIDGTLGKGGVSFCAGIRAQAGSGTVRVLGEHLLIENTEEAVLYIGCETTFYTDDPAGELRRRLENAFRLGYEEIKSRHIRDYQSLFRRMTFKVGGPDSAYVQTYFQFARYLLISSSRPGSLPANLQGIWNDQMLPPWDSKYTININTEMNYWMAEQAGLSECHLPLFEHLKRMHANGCRTAEKMYGCRGFVAHHNTDIWGDCAPQDIYLPSSYWVMGGAWLCTHIWNHYVYTKDEDFLREMYDVLRDSVLFFCDFLIIEEEGGICDVPVAFSGEYLPDGERRDRLYLCRLIHGFSDTERPDEVFYSGFGSVENGGSSEGESKSDPGKTSENPHREVWPDHGVERGLRRTGAGTPSCFPAVWPVSVTSDLAPEHTGAGAGSRNDDPQTPGKRKRIYRMELRLDGLFLFETVQWRCCSCDAEKAVEGIDLPQHDGLPSAGGWGSIPDRRQFWGSRCYSGHAGADRE